MLLEPYAKPWISLDDQVKKLAARGLRIDDPQHAARFLSHVSYYRFAGYCLAFEAERHCFAAGVRFQDVANAYRFDAALRDLLTEALEAVEIDLRTALAYSLGKSHGPFGHLDSGKFHGSFRHGEWLDRVRDDAQEKLKNNERFVKHYAGKYLDFPNLPIWMLMEIVSFGTLVRLYGGLNRIDQAPVAKRYGLQPADFGGMIHHLSYVRNIGAHHGRVWDRVWHVKTALPHGPHWQPPFVAGNERAYPTLLLLLKFLDARSIVADFAEDWKDRVLRLLGELPNCPAPLTAMGMPVEWKTHPLWRPRHRPPVPAVPRIEGG